MSQTFGCIVPSKATNSKAKTKQHHPQCSLPESVGGGEGGLFLGQSNQRASWQESTSTGRKERQRLFQRLESVAISKRSFKLK